MAEKYGVNAQTREVLAELEQAKKDYMNRSVAPGVLSNIAKNPLAGVGGEVMDYITNPDSIPSNVGKVVAGGLGAPFEAIYNKVRQAPGLIGKVIGAVPEKPYVAKNESANFASEGARGLRKNVMGMFGLVEPKQQVVELPINRAAEKKAAPIKPPVVAPGQASMPATPTPAVQAENQPEMVPYTYNETTTDRNKIADELKVAGLSPEELDAIRTGNEEKIQNAAHYGLVKEALASPRYETQIAKTGYMTPSEAQAEGILPRTELELARERDAQQRGIPATSTPGNAPVKAQVAGGKYDALYNNAGTTYGIDPAILKGQGEQESSFNPSAVGIGKNGVPSSGIAQFEERTAKDMGLSKADMFNPEKAIPAQARYIKWIKDTYGYNDSQALAAYQWGVGNMQKVKGDISKAPQDVQNYVTKVMNNSNKYRTVENQSQEQVNQTTVPSGIPTWNPANVEQIVGGIYRTRGGREMTPQEIDAQNLIKAYETRNPRIIEEATKASYQAGIGAHGQAEAGMANAQIPGAADLQKATIREKEAQAKFHEAAAEATPDKKELKDSEDWQKRIAMLSPIHPDTKERMTQIGITRELDQYDTPWDGLQNIKNPADRKLAEAAWKSRERILQSLIARAIEDDKKNDWKNVIAEGIEYKTADAYKQGTKTYKARQKLIKVWENSQLKPGLY